MDRYNKVRRETLKALSEQRGWYYPQLFLEVVHHLPPEITVLELPPGKLWQFNCYAYALGLHTHPRFFKTGSDAFIYSPFVDKLFELDELVRISRPSEAGDLIFYKNGDVLKHAGIVSNDSKIISKWSAGPLLKHDIFDVPTSYGDHIFYCEPLSKERAHQLYEQYSWFNTRIH